MVHVPAAMRREFADDRARYPEFDLDDGLQAPATWVNSRKAARRLEREKQPSFFKKLINSITNAMSAGGPSL